MVIDYDTSGLPPRGGLGWHELFDAVMAALPGDETQWIEFKANVDPSTKAGAATIAKAIVAFANRDPQTAAKWLAGHAVILVGLEPGNVVGTPEIDPAVLHDKINPLLAAPAPGWEATSVLYQGEHVLAITLDPPRQGDPIAVIGKTTVGVDDGQIYVRQVGKSAPATSSDVRRLAARQSVPPSIGGLVISPVEGLAEVAVVAFPDDWIEDWIHFEERRLLAPLMPPAPSRPATAAERRLLGLSNGALDNIFQEAEKVRRMRAAFEGRTHPETRSEDEFREEVDAYLDDCRAELPKALDRLRQATSLGVLLQIENTTATNYDQVLVELHFEGDVYGYEHPGEFSKLSDYLPRRPREWGPWTEPAFEVRETLGRTARLIAATPAAANRVVPAPAPGPTITNGGSVTVECPPLHLYPESTADLLDIWLVGHASLGDEVRVTWTATATNVDGKLKGEFMLPVASDVVDLSEQLEHSALNR